MKHSEVIVLLLVMAVAVVILYHHVVVVPLQLRVLEYQLEERMSLVEERLNKLSPDVQRHEQAFIGVAHAIKSLQSALLDRGPGKNAEVVDNQGK